MIDAFDISALNIHSSPDVRSWPITAGITAVRMLPSDGITLLFDRALPDAWKAPTGHESDNVQFTVWACVQLAGAWHAAGFVQFWQGRPFGNAALPPILTGYPFWWGNQSTGGNPHTLWGPIADYVPRAGDPFGLMITAGNARLSSGVTSVAERSNIVRLELPAGDAGAFTFDASAPPATPPSTPPATPPSTPPNGGTPGDATDQAAQLLEALERIYDGLLGITGAVNSLTRSVDAAQTNGLKLRL